MPAAPHAATTRPSATGARQTTQQRPRSEPHPPQPRHQHHHQQHQPEPPPPLLTSQSSRRRRQRQRPSSTSTSTRYVVDTISYSPLHIRSNSASALTATFSSSSMSRGPPPPLGKGPASPLSMSLGSLPVGGSSAGALLTPPPSIPIPSSRRGRRRSSNGSERKSSFSVSTWLRDPLAEIANGVRQRPTTVWHAFREIVYRAGESVALVARHSPSSSCPAASSMASFVSASVSNPSFSIGHHSTAGLSMGLRGAKSAHEECNFTWEDYHAHALAFAKVLVHLGFAPGEGAVFCTRSRPDMYFLHMAVVAAGGLVAHIRPSWRAEELLEDVFPNARARLLVVDALPTNLLAAIRRTDRHQLRAVVVLGDEWSQRNQLAWNLPVTVLGVDELAQVARDAPDVHLPALAPSGVQPGDPFLVSFGYDERGAIQGVCLSHDNVLFTAAALAVATGPLGSAPLPHRLVGYLPLAHVATQILEIYMPLLCGITIHCGGTYRGLPLDQLIALCRPTVFFAAPATWGRISDQVYRAKGEVNSFLYRWAKTRATNNSNKLRYGHEAHRSLGYMLAKKLVLNALKKRIGLGSCLACYSVLAPLDFELEKLFKTIDIPIYQLHGTPETSGFAAINYPHSWEFGTSGRALAGTTMDYDNAAQQVLHRGRNVFLGYMHHGNVVPAQGPDGWHRVPQRGHLTPAGFLKLLDAPEHFVVLSTGEWVPTEPFERCLGEQPELERAVLVGDGRPFLSVLLFLKTFSCAVGPVAGGAPGPTHAAPGRLAEEVTKLGQGFGSPATTVSEVIRCQRWSVHFDQMLEELPQRVGVSGVRVRKWIVMSEAFTVESGELEADSFAVRRRAVDGKYQTLLDSLYS